jgi:glycerate kinase
VTALASPASLKGVLGALEAARALVEGFAAAGVDAEALPVADGGGGTAEVLAGVRGGSWQEAAAADALGRPVTARWLMLPDRTAVVEAAETIGLARLHPDELDPIHASSRGLGELIHAALDAGPDELIVCIGDTATVDGGAGLMEVLGGFPVPARAACDVRNPLLGERGAAAAFGAQKGASPAQIPELEASLAARKSLRPFSNLPGAGAGGGLGAAMAALGAELVSGAELVLEVVDFSRRLRSAELVVTGEGTIDSTTMEGKAPSAVLLECLGAGVRCAVFGGLILEPLLGAELHPLSGDPGRARDDLVALGELLGAGLYY